MNKILWKIADVSWLVAFELLLSMAMKIPLIGMAFIPILLLFTWLFSKTVSKFGNSWIVWSIPYTLSVILFLGLFTRENILTFTFKTFWLSLATWFTSPVSPFGMAVLIFVISYVVAYLTAHLLKNTLNTFIALAVSAAIAGIATQYCCLTLSLGFMLLFILALAFNNVHGKKKLTRQFLTIVMITIVIGSAFFLFGTYFKPSTPLEHLFVFKTTVTHHVLSSNSSPLVSRSVAQSPIQGIPHFRKIVRNSGMENTMFEIIMDVVGILIISVGIAAIIGMLVIKKKRKKKVHWKNLLYVIWIIASAFFVLMLVMYTFGMLNFKANRTFNLTYSTPLNIPNSAGRPLSFASTNTSLPSQGGMPPITNPIIWIALAVMGIVIILYMTFKFVKDASYASEKEKSGRSTEWISDFDKSKNVNFSGKPWKIVLFYYNLLRDISGNHSATPSEFEKVLEEKIGSQNAKKITETFVKLRYAHDDISEEDAYFVREQAKRIISKDGN